jgi:hypothetical protein
MRSFVHAVAGEQERRARAEMDPPRTAAVLRPENDLKPEISLSWRIFHAEAYLKAVAAGEREDLARFEKRLSALGLKQGHW